MKYKHLCFGHGKDVFMKKTIIAMIAAAREICERKDNF